MPFLILTVNLLGLVTSPRPRLYQGPRLPRQPHRLLGGRPVHGLATKITKQATLRLPEGPGLVPPLHKVLRLPEEINPTPLYSTDEARIHPPAVADDDPDR